MTLPEPAGSTRHRNTGFRETGGFQVQLFIRTVETPLAPPLDPADHSDWKRFAGAVVIATVVPLAIGALAMVFTQ